MSRWFRMYADALDDPKVQRLPAPLFKAWINLLCLASRNDGVLPPIGDVAFALRMDENVTRDTLLDLIACGLIDDGESLSPHNWCGRQFKSDADETATERKRAQRERDKERKKGNVTPPVTDDVTRDESVMSHPPDTEQNRTEQSRADARAQESDVKEETDPDHWAPVQAVLTHRSQEVDDWELDFLHSVKWKRDLTKSQADSLKAILGKLTFKAMSTKAPPARVMVKEGSPAWQAWKKTGRRFSALDLKDETGRVIGRGWYFETEFPPAEEKAA
mgnify:CR=1 FL=1